MQSLNKLPDFVATLSREKLRHHVVLSKEQEMQIQRIESEYVARDRIAHCGLKYAKKILLFGMPNCGKAAAVERLAWNLGLPLIEFQFDVLLNSDNPALLKETLISTARVAVEQPSLLLIDSCDVLALTPKNLKEHFNGDCILSVVKFLRNIVKEYNSNTGLLFVTVNTFEFGINDYFREIIDFDFDAAIEISNPAIPEIEILLRQTLACFDTSQIDFAAIANQLDVYQLLASQVIRLAQVAGKNAILDGNRLILTDRDMQNVIEKAKDYWPS